MAFLNDLDGFAWAATIAALVVWCLVTFVDFQDWLDRQKIDNFDGRATLVTFFAMAFIVGAFNSYSPNANAPRKTVKGMASFVAKASGKGSYDEYICATSCELTGGYALDLHNEAARIPHMGSSYVFTYLEHPVGNAFAGISLQVIAIAEPDSGRVLYALDLSNHPYRIALYLLDTALVVSAGLLGGLLNRSRRLKDEAAASNEEDENETLKTRDGPISLGLESKDAS